MEILIILMVMIQAMAVSLGFGVSTLTIIHFFVALRDGKITGEERRLIGINYIVLRVGMVLILLTTLTLTFIGYLHFGVGYFDPYVLGFWVLIFVLFINAILMTVHIVPLTIGPAIQAASWYTMGIFITLPSVGLDNFSFHQFAIGYAIMIIIFAIVVYGMLAILKKLQQKDK